MDWQWWLVASVFIALLFALVGCFCVAEWARAKWRARKAGAVHQEWPTVDDYVERV